MKKFELFVGAFPAGDVYCNKAAIVRDDYKQIAFIDYTGKLSLSVDPSYIPHDVLIRIERDADTKAANFRKNWEKLPELKRYEKLLDSSGLGGVLYIHYLPDDFTLADKIDFLEWIVYGWLPHSAKVADVIENYKNSKYYKGVTT